MNQPPNRRAQQPSKAKPEFETDKQSTPPEIYEHPTADDVKRLMNHPPNRKCRRALGRYKALKRSIRGNVDRRSLPAYAASYNEIARKMLAAIRRVRHYMGHHLYRHRLMVLELREAEELYRREGYNEDEV